MTPIDAISCAQTLIVSIFIKKVFLNPRFLLAIQLRLNHLTTPELRHRHRRLSLAAMMMFKFHGPVKTEGAVAVACSYLLAVMFKSEFCRSSIVAITAGHRALMEEKIRWVNPFACAGSKPVKFSHRYKHVERLTNTVMKYAVLVSLSTRSSISDKVGASKLIIPMPYSPCMGPPIGQMPFDNMDTPKINQATAPNEKAFCVARQSPTENRQKPAPQPSAPILDIRCGSPGFRVNSLACCESAL
jgi:hypothetical protein